jgi:putative hydrolase of the HAD superfamily
LPRISVFKDVLAVLPVLKKEYRLGLITDGLKLVQKNKVKALKIGDYFDATVFATDYGGKCSQKPFLMILEKLHVKADESVYVDDNPYTGFAVAKQLGIRTIRMLRGENKDLLVTDLQVKPDMEISNLYQLEDSICEIDSL